MKHAKVTTYTTESSGDVTIDHESYYEQLASVVREIRKQSVTSKETIVKDLIKGLEHITRGNSPKVTFVVEAKRGEPVKLITTHVEYKESFNRR